MLHEWRRTVMGTYAMGRCARICRSGLVCVVAIFAFTGVASAATFNYSSYTVIGQSVTIQTPRSVTGTAGQVTLVAPGPDLLVFCLDIYDNLAKSGSYTVSQLTQASQLTTASAGSAMRLTMTQIGEIGSLILHGDFLIAKPPQGTSATVVSAAIQLAIWDVEYNNPYKKYGSSHNSQNVFAYTGIPSGTVNLANTYLANIEAGGIWSAPVYKVNILTQAGNQTMAYVTPLPGTLPLFATGLGVVGLLARRRKRKAELVVQKR